MSGNTAFPNADRIMAEGFLLGCHHGTNFAQIDRACDLLKAFEAKMGSQSAAATVTVPKKTKTAAVGSDYVTLDY